MGIYDRIREMLLANERKEAVTEPLPTRAPVIPIERRTRTRVNARRGTSVLIVDDSKTIVVALSRMLQPSGFLISEAFDGETGVAMARASRPNLIFLDIVMPGLNGFAALRALRRDPETQDVPVIMMSGNEHATEQFFGSRIPADDFMKKPFSRLEVFARIQGLLDDQFVPQRRVAAGARRF
ncbi:MAG: response regulator [Gammaproteobacteria bacterium]|nr:response regulator [Gammaproteobacteria bacterium]MBU1414775.1 response regulator [Gammaproteobacteria bacterium]